MEATGITAEYNPLHNGHVYHLQQSRAVTACDVLVAAMSGDYVQRGEPAVLDKWTRCGLALDAGADIVAEIPVVFCLGNAAQYASASVAILEALGCKNITFGSESGDLSLITGAAGFLDEYRAPIDERIGLLAKEGLSYPSARLKAFRDVYAAVTSCSDFPYETILKSSNDILAVEYVKAMSRAAAVAVKRSGAVHDAGYDPGNYMQSASAIREALRRGDDADDFSAYMPPSAVHALKSCHLSFTDEWTEILRYSILSTTSGSIEECPSAGEGLGNLIKESAKYNKTWNDIINGAKSRRYTYTRISRLCMQIILGIRRDMHSTEGPGYIRILGFSEKGRRYLSEIKHNSDCALPLLTNINKETHGLDARAQEMLAFDVHASDIYDLVTGRGVMEWSDHVKQPVRCGKDKK